MIEYHTLHVANRAARRIEELMIAGAVGDQSGKLFKRVWQFFDRQAAASRRRLRDEEPESQTPLSLAEFERMVKESET